LALYLEWRFLLLEGLMRTNEPDAVLHSAIYTGEVWHKRHTPREHGFTYKVFMAYLDLDEMDTVFSLSRWWSSHLKYWPAFFNRADYFTHPNNPSLPLIDSVRTAVQDELGFSPSGPIRLLTNLRYFGYLTNPISIYYCFDAGGKDLQALLLEVTNTPWGERQHYVLDCRDGTGLGNCKPGTEIEFGKTMHVSPFIPMNMRYRWSGNVPGDTLAYRLCNWQYSENDLCEQKQPEKYDSNKLYFSAGVNFSRQAMTSKNMRMVLIRFPLMTVKVISAIYWQALRLRFKGIRFLPHPDRARSEPV